MEDSVMETQSKQLETGKAVKGTVVKINMAAALVDIGTEKPAVLHISQLVTPTREPITQVEDVLTVGQELDVYVRREEEKVIQLTMVKPLALPWRKIEDGMTVKGTVVRLETFGAFIDIGAERPGLVHISEIAHGYVKTPGDVLKEGQEIEVQVLESNRRKKQIKLSIKALQEPPAESEEGEGESNDYFGSRSNDRRGGRRGGRRREKGPNVKQVLAEINEPADETDTAMAAALRAAMEGSNDSKPAAKGKKQKSNATQDDLLSRTLGSRAEE
ncbi:MAG: S1 RNA-binding domain-containing protein [Anaerolineae bacterium]|jgi:ribosomal protein S1|nr:S1 RNA-binding domain-containing protein [Anaerolineae bacterium]